MLALALLACDDPDALEGRIVDSRKSPYAAVLVAGLEDQARSDSTGVFRVKVPVGQPVVFEVGRTTYRRVRTPDDVGVVDLVLPDRRHTKVHCPPEPCPLKLDWHLAEGFDALFRAECTRGAELPIEAPLGLPEVRCGEVDVEVLDRPDGLWIVTPGRPARVRVRAADGGFPPEDCAVFVGQVPAEPDGPGAWKGTAHGDVVFSAVCEGRPALPVAVPADQPTDDVLLTWSRTGPRIDLAATAPWARELALTGEGVPLRVRSETGVFELPPLPAGVWSVEVVGANPAIGETVMIPPAIGGRLVVLPAGRERLIGTLRLDAPVAAGEIPTR